MATIVKRKNADGGLSYRLQVMVRNKGTGKRETKVMTWRKPDGMTEREADREIKKVEIEFEDKVRLEADNLTGIKSSIKVKDYSQIWLEEHVRNSCALTYYASTKQIIGRMNEHIGNYSLEDLTPVIIQRYIDKIASTQRVVIKATAKPKLKEKIQKKMTIIKLCTLAELSTTTMKKAFHGEAICEEKALAIAKVLGNEVTTLFKIETISEPYAPETIAKHYRTLRSMLSVAKKQQIVKENYAKSEYITQPKDRKKPIICLDDRQSKILSQALWNEPDIRIKTALLTLLLTGIRRGELYGLEWQDINLELGEIKIQRASVAITGMGVITTTPKTETSTREITMPSSLVELMTKYKNWWENYTESLGDRYDGCRRLFLQDTGKPMYPSTALFWLRKLLAKLDLPDVTVHSLRHTNITMQLIAGVPLKTVSVRAGHSSTKVTSEVYSHFIKTSDKEAADKLNNLFGKAK